MENAFQPPVQRCMVLGLRGSSAWRFLGSSFQGSRFHGLGHWGLQIPDFNGQDVQVRFSFWVQGLAVTESLVAKCVDHLWEVMLIEWT